MIRVAVATSGGRDSTALLHATVCAMRRLGGEVVALHVHHGLQTEADQWLLQVKRQALRWGARFDARRLTGAPQPGDSIEAWARAGRYAALTEMAGAAGCGLVLLAHHRRDQAETWLLQALRGGSAASLASMPHSATRRGILWARPWLHRPRELVEAYVRRHRISYVDDPSNGDARLARNRLRLQVWPALLAAFPAAEEALTAAAQRAQRASALAKEVLAADLPDILRDEALHLASWLQLPPARRRNALQGWLTDRLGRTPPDSLCDRLLDELRSCRVGRWATPSEELRLYRGLLRLEASPGGVAALRADQTVATASGEAGGPQALRLDRPGIYPLPAWGGTLQILLGGADGASPRLLREAHPQARSGGERFRLAPQALARSLKKQYQSCGVPAWERGGPLLVGAAGQLIFVPGLGIDAGAQAGLDEEGLHIVWSPAGTAR